MHMKSNVMENYSGKSKCVWGSPDSVVCLLDCKFLSNCMHAH